MTGDRQQRHMTERSAVSAGGGQGFGEAMRAKQSGAERSRAVGKAQSVVFLDAGCAVVFEPPLREQTCTSPQSTANNCAGGGDSCAAEGRYGRLADVRHSRGVEARRMPCGVAIRAGRVHRGPMGYVSLIDVGVAESGAR